MSSNKRPDTAKPTQKTSKTKSARPVKRAVKPSASNQKRARPAPLIVGIGASADGLEAFTQLLQHFAKRHPPGTGAGRSPTMPVVAHESQNPRNGPDEKLTADALRESEERLCQTNIELGQRVAELQAANLEIQDARRAALNVMEDSVRSREQVENLNLQLRREVSERERAQGLQAAQMRALELTVANAPLAEVLEALVRTIEAQSPSGMLGSILLLDGNGLHLRHGAAPSLAEEYNSAIDGIAIGPGVGSCGTAAFTKELVYVSDIAADPLWADFRDLAQCHGLRACWSTPIMSGSGKVLGTFAMYYHEPREPTALDLELVNVATRTAALVIERKHAEAALHQSEERFRAIVSQVIAGIAETDLTGRFVHTNERYCEMVGYSPAELSRMRMQDITHPEDLPRNVEMFEELARTGTNFVIEKRYVRKDGSIIWVSNSVSGVKHATGKLANIAAVSIDITERKRHEEQRELLIAELNHRVKNTLATVQSFAIQSLRNAKTVAEGRESFQERLMALSRAHDVLTRERWEGADMNQVVADAIAAYSGGSHQSRFQVAGPIVRLRPKAVLALSMALHELATNAVKYGALSNQAGRVDLTWGLMIADDPGRFHLRWMESGGPPVVPPTRRGFGSRLIEQGLMQDLASEVRMNFEKRGLVCTIDAPLDEIAGVVR